MRSGGGMQKGSAFERRICKRLSKWVSHGKRDDVFWRSAMSGGRATIGLRVGISRSAQAGDVVAIAGEGENFLKHFVVECKSRKNLQLQNLITKRSGMLWTFWVKHLKECKAFSRLPFMVAKQNQQPILLLLSKRGFDLFGYSPELRKAVLAKIPIYETMGRVPNMIYILDFEQFLKSTTYTL